MKLRSSTLLFAGLIALWLALNLAGGVLIKYIGVRHDDLRLAVILFVLIFGTWGGRAAVSMLIGQKFQLSYAYPFLGLNYVLSIPVGMVLFQESFRTQRLAGSIVILCGILILMRSANKLEARK